MKQIVKIFPQTHTVDLNVSIKNTQYINAFSALLLHTGHQYPHVGPIDNKRQ